MLILMKDQLVKSLQLSLVIPINFLVATSGVVANALNILVFARLGFKNTMSIGTMSLSLTDLFVSIVQLATDACFILHYVTESSDIDFYTLGASAIGWFKYAGINISFWITTLIALERCACVVFPLKVKQICTKLIYRTFLVAIYATYLSLALPMYVGQRLVWIPNNAPERNSSSGPIRYIFTLDYNEEIIRLQVIFDAVGVYALATLSQAILLVCTARMISSLKNSSLVRLSGIRPPDIIAHPSTRGLVSPLSSREKKLIKVAVCLAVVMTTCNIPRYIVIALFNTWPKLQEQENVEFSCFLWDASDIFANINCSSSFLVYLIVNQSFRKCLHDILNRKVISTNKTLHKQETR